MTAATTQRTYTACLNRMKLTCIGRYISHPAEVVEWITANASKTGSIDTQNTYINSVLWHLRTTAETPHSDELSAALEVYMKAAKRLQVLRNAKSKSQTLPEAKLAEMIEWPEVLALDEKAKKDLSEEDYLIFSFYTKMPPLRADFANLSILPRFIKTRPDNYIVYSTNIKKWRLVLNNYKTSKTFGQQVITLPASLAELLTSKADSFLVLNMTENNLGKRVTAIFEKLCGKKMSINLLRHSYIKNFLSTKRTILEREALALRMLHSTGLQEKYDILTLPQDDPPEEEEESVSETTPSSTPPPQPPQ